MGRIPATSPVDLFADGERPVVQTIPAFRRIIFQTRLVFVKPIIFPVLRVGNVGHHHVRPVSLAAEASKNLLNVESPFAPLVRGRVVRRSLEAPPNPLRRSRKPFWIADKIRHTRLKYSLSSLFY